MPLPVPRLDDRRYDDLVEEARERITRLCPGWTDFNPSDPGVTLVELMAWLTDLTLYRLNRIPDRSRAVFLNMMGVQLRPAEAARTWLLFEPRSLPTFLDTGTEAQARGDDGPPIVFGTTAPLNLTAARPVAVAFSEGEAVPQLVGIKPGETPRSLLRTRPGGRSMRLSAEDRPAQHMLFLGDAKALSPAPTAPLGGLLHLDITLAEPVAARTEIEWQRVAAGESPNWRPWTPESDATRDLRRSGRITFAMGEPIVAAPAELEPGIDGAPWLRGWLLRADPDQLPAISALTYTFMLPPEAQARPDRVCLGSPESVFAEFPVPQAAGVGGVSVPLRPFQAEQPLQSALLVSSPHIGRAEAEITLAIQLRSEGDLPGAAQPELRFEVYGAGGRWIAVGRSTPSGSRGEPGMGRFEDGTDALTTSGTVVFRSPPDQMPFSVRGEPGFFLRIRLAAGIPHRVVIEDLRISFADPPRPFGLAVAQNAGQTNLLDFQAEPARPFVLRSSDDLGPALLVALGERPDNALQRLFLDLRPPRVGGGRQRSRPSGLRSYYIAAADRSPSPVAWSYRGPAGWCPLTLVEDTTRDMTMRGTIAFVAPDDWTVSDATGARGYWLRAQLDPLSDPSLRPGLDAVATNCVEAAQAEIVRDVMLVPRTDEVPDDGRWRSFELPGPVLPGLVLAVREADAPSEDTLAALRAQRGVVIESALPAAPQAVWVRWTEVANFYRSGPDSRHYVFDPVASTVTFGDGRHGRIPPAGANRIRLVTLLRGGGASGNVGADKVDQLVRSIPGIDSVTNPVAAEGGADAEEPEQAMDRGPSALRHRDRAVTAQDYEQLALEASTSVARASCSVVDGGVRVLVIPADRGETPYPGRYLVDRVQSYLEDRRIVGTRLHVTGPSYAGILADITVVLRPTHVARMAQVRDEIEAALRKFVHPVDGGPDVFLADRKRVGADADAKGWPLGRTLHLSELYYVVEQIEGVDHADDIRLATAEEADRPRREWARDRIAVAPDALPHFLRIDVRQAR